MWDRDITFGLGSAAAFLAWIGGALCVAGAWCTERVELGAIGVFLAAAAAALTIMRDNAKTRRVIRALMRENAAERQLARIH